MRHGRSTSKLGVKSKHRKALLKNLVNQLVFRKRIRTTLNKAKAASRVADKLVQLAKRGDSLHARRQLIAKLDRTDTVSLLIKDIAPLFKDRNGGYTRVIRLHPRAGDGADMAILEFTATFAVPEKKKKTKDKKSSADKASAPKDKAAKAPASEKAVEKETKKAGKEKAEEKPETEKKGGFLGTLRKFLKGDDR